MTKTELIAGWRIVHAIAAEDEWAQEEADFRSLCVGWCMAQGLNIEQAHSFYGEMIKAGYF